MRLIAPVVAAMLLVCGMLPGARAAEAVASQPPVDLPRFMGTWYVIARIPNAIERGDVAARNEYTLREADKVAVRYVSREGFGEPEEEVNARATVDAESGNRRWRLWFYRVVPTKYRILEVAPDYSWALIDYPGRDLAWVFSRKPEMEQAQYRELLTRMREEYDINTDKLRRVPQLREQVGKLGFDVPKKR
ncbi:lipocalin family protein [Stenotrophomonas sp. MMGLT7]|uniref:lipocalin family protein n=1 Tax=Stenotrophomonas sp. MMGLT7 TaxID=2901227 RepID=UPI001E41ADCA|nr:lipocalin family protein [Stenotrophomonas sp. MMGLT7]MCD7098342.1 lipocalin family protein [Stenotrophomonas sp. MMGLT7]